MLFITNINYFVFIVIKYFLSIFLINNDQLVNIIKHLFASAFVCFTISENLILDSDLFR